MLETIDVSGAHASYHGGAGTLNDYSEEESERRNESNLGLMHVVLYSSSGEHERRDPPPDKISLCSCGKSLFPENDAWSVRSTSSRSTSFLPGKEPDYAHRTSPLSSPKNIGFALPQFGDRKVCRGCAQKANTSEAGYIMKEVVRQQLLL